MKKKRKIRFLALFMVALLVSRLNVLPAFAAQAVTDERSTATNVQKVTSYATQLKNGSKVNVTTGSMGWDTEKKPYSWAYFNGLMLDAFMMMNPSGSASYVEGFYKANINSDGSIINLEAGKPPKWALDNYEAMRAAFDLLPSTSEASRIKNGIQYLYSQLEQMTSYSDCGGNFVHKQDADGSPSSEWAAFPVALDGLYMAQPFLMECANAIDRGNLTLKDAKGNIVTSESLYNAVYNRFTWIYSNLYNSSTMLFDHGYTPDGRYTNGVSWTRSIGWYAMALVDVIDMMPSGSRKSTLISELPRLFDGMLRYQDPTTGLWYNVTAYNSSLDKNYLETSGSVMMAYTLFKAYKNGWVSDNKYAEAGLKAFNGTIANKMTESQGSYSVKDTYRSSGVSTDPAYYTKAPYTTNEAKGVGSLIMAATMANEVAKKFATPIPERLYDEATGIAVVGSKARAMQVKDISENISISDLDTDLKAYDISLTDYTEGTEKTIYIPIPADMEEEEIHVYFLPISGNPVEMNISRSNNQAIFTTKEIGIFAIGHPVRPEETESSAAGSGGSESGGADQPGSGDSGNPGGGDSGGTSTGEPETDEPETEESGSDVPDIDEPDIVIDDPLTITIHDTTGKAADTFEAYQIFSGILTDSASIGRKIEWGDGILTTDGMLEIMGQSYTALELVTAYTLGDISVTDMLKAIEANLSETCYTSTPAENPYNAIIHLPAPGYYFVKNTDGSASDGQAYTRFLVRVVGAESVHMDAKTDAPTVNKKVKNQGEENEYYREGNNGKIGDLINYKINASVPDMSAYEEYTYNIFDTMSPGLSYQEGSLQVLLAGEMLPNEDYSADIRINESGETELAIIFHDFIKYKGQTGATITVTYDAIINEHAIIGSEGNPNAVYLVYTNDPNHTGEETLGKTPTEWTKTFVIRLMAYKYDGKDGKALEGASFTLTGTQDRAFFTDADGNLHPKEINMTVTSDTLGFVDFATLGAGTYQITEITAPDGYNRLKADIELKIFCDSDAKEIIDGSEKAEWTITVNGEAVTDYINNDKVQITVDPSVYLIGIQNNAGSILPSTGGMGTTIFRLTGLILVVIAAVLLVTKRISDSSIS